MITDRELFNLVAGKGIQFLDLSFDVVPTREGYALRAVDGSANVVLFDVHQDDASLVAALRAELDATMWAAITGRNQNVDVSWGRGG